MDFVGSLRGEFNHPIFRVPSTSAQTFLSKTLLEHATSVVHVAVVAASSSSLRNSSIGANMATAFKVDADTIRLFSTVFSPDACFSVQFSPKLNFGQPLDRSVVPKYVALIDALKECEYFYKSLCSFTVMRCRAVADRLFSFDDNNNNKNKNNNNTFVDAAEDDSGDDPTAILKKMAARPPFLRLDSLRIVDCEINNPSCFAISMYPGALGNLKILDLTYSRFSDDGLELLLEKVSPALQTLILDDCYHISDDVFEVVARQAPNLTTLRLMECEQLGGGFLRHIAKLSQLTFLDLAEVEDVDDDDIEEFQQAVPGCKVRW
jgi:hypothetical protein